MSDLIGFIGLGSLGLPMATNLLKAGYALRVYNRTASKAEPLLALGAQQAAQPADAATMVKLIGNFMIFSAGYTMREALAMAAKNGVDPKPVVEMLTQTLFSAPIYQSYGRRIAENGAFFPQTAIPVKDIGLLRQTARQVESSMPIASLLSNLLSGEGGSA